MMMIVILVERVNDVDVAKLLVSLFCSVPACLGFFVRIFSGDKVTFFFHLVQFNVRTTVFVITGYVL